MVLIRALYVGLNRSISQNGMPIKGPPAPRFMLICGRPAAAKKDWMNTRMTFDSRAPHRSLFLPLIVHDCALKEANKSRRVAL